MPSVLCGFGDGDFSPSVESLLATNRRQDDRSLPLYAKQLRGSVDFGHVDQPPRAQVELRKRLAIGHKRGISVDTFAEGPGPEPDGTRYVFLPAAVE